MSDVLGVTPMLGRLARIEAGEGNEEDFAEANWTLESRIEVALAEAGLPAVALDRRIARASAGASGCGSAWPGC